MPLYQFTGETKLVFLLLFSFC